MTQSSDTPTRLIHAATRQFAARGYAGASIASVAQELGLTKQALLHHFGTKDRLYEAVLDGLADRIMAAIGDTDDVVKTFERFLDHAGAHPDDAALIARELLDQDARAETGRQWFLIPFLNRLTALARGTRPDFTDAEALAEVYAHLGGLLTYVVSGPTLRGVYGKKALRELDAALRKVLRKQAKRRFLAKKTGRKV
ncbi:MAG: TetR/AcrR family transcriptional regulator [Proteobacteria bacterium]|nr:TetR/AcrR family transcriptional regulator [Pseudomonadota bacterium]